jgi:hypothetical protein
VTVRQPPPPPSVSMSASPTDGYVCLGTPVTMSWNVANCGASCSVTLTGKGYGYAAKFQITLPNLKSSGSYTTTPGDQIDFTVSASSPFGSNSATKSMTIAPPSACGGGGSPPSLSVYYFAVKASDPAVIQCTWLAVVGDTESNTLKAVQSSYGSTYTVTSITLDEYNQHQKCP